MLNALIGQDKDMSNNWVTVFLRRRDKPPGVVGGEAKVLEEEGFRGGGR